MFNNTVKRLLIGSTILSSVLSLIIITLTVIHHLKMEDTLDEIEEKGFI